MTRTLVFRRMAGVLILAILAVGTTVWATNKRSHLGRIRVENKTRSVVVKSVNDLGGAGEFTRLEVKIKNRYKKPIGIFRVIVSDEQTAPDSISAVERGGLADDWNVQPNETSTISFSAAAKGEVILTIAAVLFEDGTGDGDIDDVTQLQEFRTGVRMAYEKILPIFDAKKSDESTDSQTILQFLEDQLKQINDADIPSDSRQGFSQTKNFIGYEIKDIKEKLRGTPSLDVNAEVNKQLEKFKARLSKLSR